jgi:hypothetical protein
LDHEYDDAGGTYRVFNGVSLSLLDGRALQLPDESNIDNHNWVEGCCSSHLDEAAESRVEARIEADPTLDRADAMLMEIGAEFDLDLDAIHLLVDVTSFLARQGDDGGMSFLPSIDPSMIAPIDAELTTAAAEEVAA